MTDFLITHNTPQIWQQKMHHRALDKNLSVINWLIKSVAGECSVVELNGQLQMSFIQSVLIGYKAVFHQWTTERHREAETIQMVWDAT